MHRGNVVSPPVLYLPRLREQELPSSCGGPQQECAFAYSHRIFPRRKQHTSGHVSRSPNCIGVSWPDSTRVWEGWTPSQWNVAVFFAGIRVALVFEGTKRGDDAGSGVGGFDDGVNVAALGSDEGIGEAVAEFGDFFLAEFFAPGFGSFVELALVDDIHRTLGTHYGNLRRRPGEIGVGTDVFGGHHAVRATVGLAGDDSDFRDGGFGEGEKELRAMLDDAAELLLRTGEKARNVFEGDERNVKGVAETHEASSLHGSDDVENTGKEGRLIADNADGPAVEARKAHDEVLGIMLMDFEEITVVNNRVEGVLNVVRLLGIGGNE